MVAGSGAGFVATVAGCSAGVAATAGVVAAVAWAATGAAAGVGAGVAALLAYVEEDNMISNELASNVLCIANNPYLYKLIIVSLSCLVLCAQYCSERCVMYVVTGGGSGLGRALACALAMRGQSVLIVGRTETALTETASFSPNIQYFCADVALAADRVRLVAHLSETQYIQALVHNAGIIDPIAPITEINETAWCASMATNLDAPLFLSQMLYKKLINGRVLHIGSGAAHFPVVGWAAYCVSKAALAMLTRCWQLESNSVAFASVMPGIVDTNMQREIREASHMDSEKRDFFKRLQQANQLLSPETVALFLCWLLLDTDATCYVSQEWDIYDKTHHVNWLIPPHVVPEFE